MIHVLFPLFNLASERRKKKGKKRNVRISGCGYFLHRRFIRRFVFFHDSNWLFDGKKNGQTLLLSSQEMFQIQKAPIQMLIQSNLDSITDISVTSPILLGYENDSERTNSMNCTRNPLKKYFQVCTKNFSLLSWKKLLVVTANILF